MTAGGVLTEKHPILRIKIGWDGSLNIETDGTHGCGRDLQGTHAVWVEQREDSEYDVSGMLPNSLKKTSEFIYRTVTPRTVFREPFDILSRETRHVSFGYIEEPGESEPPQADMLPIKLEEPSPHLLTLRFYNFPVTQELLDIAAECPNLERLVIANTHLGTPSAPQDPITHIPAPANASGMKTWMFNVSGVDTVADWTARKLDNLMLSQTGMDHIPPGLLTSEDMLKVTARHSRLGTAAAEDAFLAALRCGDVAKLDLTGNLIREIPLPPNGNTRPACYHSDSVTFGNKCVCQTWKNSTDEPNMLSGDPSCRSRDPELRETSEYNPRHSGIDTNRTIVGLGANPLNVGHYQHLAGGGRDAHESDDESAMVWYQIT